MAGLTQTHDRALLMWPARARRYREDTRLKHPFEAATRNLDRDSGAIMIGRIDNAAWRAPERLNRFPGVACGADRPTCDASDADLDAPAIQHDARASASEVTLAAGNSKSSFSEI